MSNIIHYFDIPDHIYNDLMDCINDKSTQWNSELAGNIREEYSLHKYIPKFENFLLSQIKDSPYLSEYLKHYHILTNPLPLRLINFWVNFQKKHEFNPLHKHTGLLSFVLFMKIPYLMEEEKKIGPGALSNTNIPGCLSFVYPSSEIGGIEIIKLEVDKKWEKKGVIFKADLNHVVNPFYSDGTRITISGNMLLENPKSKEK
tara:strand:+ start:672 stop:1277 length:606 start_codon:yes stop_codon:yes gene_type:complete